MKSEQIQTLHPQPGKINKLNSMDKYNHTELMEKLYDNVKDNFEGGVQ